MRSQLARTLSAMFLTAATSSTYAHTQSPVTQQPHSVVVVELFTSEGCSSCPPADALLRQVHLKQTPQQQLILGISEHVTYWDRLGWKDPYSLNVFTERQNQYASRFGLDGPYTPQMVVNGRNQFVGSDAQALQQALLRNAQGPHTALHIVSSTRSGKEWDVAFTVAPSSKPLDIYAVFTDDSDRTDVPRGENAGRSLMHISVARSLMRVAQVAAGTQHSQSIHLPMPFQAGEGKGHHLILFAQEQHQEAIVGADDTSL